MRSVVASHRSDPFGDRGGDNETAIFTILTSNRRRTPQNPEGFARTETQEPYGFGGKTLPRQCLVGSLNGAFSSKRVTEEFIKVGLARMEIGQDVQTQKPA